MQGDNVTTHDTVGRPVSDGEPSANALGRIAAAGEWLDHRAGVKALKETALDEKLPAGTGWWLCRSTPMPMKPITVRERASAGTSASTALSCSPKPVAK